MSARWTAQRRAAAMAAGRNPGRLGRSGKLASSDIARQAARVHGSIAGRVRHAGRARTRRWTG